MTTPKSGLGNRNPAVFRGRVDDGRAEIPLVLAVEVGLGPIGVHDPVQVFIASGAAHRAEGGDDGGEGRNQEEMAHGRIPPRES